MRYSLNIVGYCYSQKGSHKIIVNNAQCKLMLRKIRAFSAVLSKLNARLFRSVHPPLAPGGNLLPNSDDLSFPFNTPSLPSFPVFFSPINPSRSHFPSLLSFSFPLSPFFPLRSRTPWMQLGGLGSTVSSPSVVWGEAPAKIEFGVFLPLKYNIW